MSLPESRNDDDFRTDTDTDVRVDDGSDLRIERTGEDEYPVVDRVEPVDDLPAGEPPADEGRPAVIDLTDDTAAEPATEPVTEPVTETSAEPVTGLTAEATTATSPADSEWLELQSRFVDDPRAAVEGAAGLVERALADLRGRVTGTDSTEELRSAFRSLRDLHRSLL